MSYLPVFKTDERRYAWRPAFKSQYHSWYNTSYEYTTQRAVAFKHLSELLHQHAARTSIKTRKKRNPSQLINSPGIPFPSHHNVRTSSRRHTKELVKKPHENLAERLTVGQALGAGSQIRARLCFAKVFIVCHIYHRP